MGLLEVLGLKTTTSNSTSPGRGAPANLPPPPGDASADPVATELAAIDLLLAGVGDEKAKAALIGEAATLRANHEQAEDLPDASKRAAAASVALAAARKLHARAQQIADADAQKRSVSDARADLDAIVGQIATLIAGIAEPAPRKHEEAELAKLRAAVAKAKQAAPQAVAAKSLAAVTAAAETLRARADRTKDAVDWAHANLVPLESAAGAAIGAMPGAAKAVLQKELAALHADIGKHEEAADRAALESSVAPRLDRVRAFASGMPKVAAQADQDLAQAAQAIAALDAATATPLLATLKALQAQRVGAWPSGDSLDALEASVGVVTQGAKALIEAARQAQAQVVLQKDIAALQQQLDALRPRIDKAGESGAPSYVEQRQQNVRALSQTMRAQLASSKKDAAEATLRSLRLALDDMEKFKALHAAYRARMDAAKGGPIKAALAMKLAPAELAASRDKAIAQRERDIDAMTANGVFTLAEAEIPKWTVEAKAWAAAKKAYDDLHGKDPSPGTLENLAELPGGGPVLDALVADLPDAVPQKVMTTAIRARFGIKVRQFDHRDGKGANPKEDAKALNPNAPDRALKGLYKVLGKVPIKDVRQVEKIDRFADESGGADYDSGIINDKIDLYCGRPDDGNTQDFNIEGEVVPRGEKVKPGCEPVNTGVAMPYFDFATLHEVGHAVDDAEHIMKGDRAKDAGWESHGTGHIAKVAANFFHYDADYIESMLDSKTNTPPKHAPKPPNGVKPADWDAARVTVEAWTKATRVTSKPWWNAGSAKDTQIGGRCYLESYEGDWASYKFEARSQGITGYQFRSAVEWFAELYAAFHTQRLNPKHPATAWLRKLKSKSLTS